MRSGHKQYLVQLWDRKIRTEYYKVLSAVSVLVALLSIKPINDIAAKCDNESIIWKIVRAFYLVSLIAAYFILWIYANKIKKINLNINGNVVKVKQGNIFDEPDDVWKVINANEYFDTELGGKESLVSSESVEGQYLQKFYAEGAKELDERITDQLSSVKGKRKRYRKHGKGVRYPLGTIFSDTKDGRRYLLTAFSRMDDSNRAYLSMKDYVNFLMAFWEEIDKVYDGHSITISLFGTGIVRLDNLNISPQELLELILWSFKHSRIQLAYGAIVTILLYGETDHQVNLYKLT